jgi:GNAT superfamily N-acetyltransferase
MTPDFAEQRRARLRKEAEAARLAAVAAPGRQSECALRVRVLGPADLDNIAGLFERLSWRSRYLRFMSPGRITNPMVRYFADVDHERHEAVGAFDDDRLVGSAHYFRVKDASTHAEIAAEVVDRYQRQGIGTRLLHELAGLARGRGITHFRATVLLENTAALALLSNLGWLAVKRQDGPVLAVTATITELAGTETA